MRKQIKLLFLTLILIFGFTSLGICIEPKYKWNIFLREFNSTTGKSDTSFVLDFKEIYKNQDYMEYKISNSGWKCSMESISKGNTPKIRHDDNQYGIIESLTVSCSMDNFRNIVYKTTKCQNSDLGNNRGKIVTNNNMNGLSFVHLNNKGEKIYYHFQIMCFLK